MENEAWQEDKNNNNSTGSFCKSTSSTVLMLWAQIFYNEITFRFREESTNLIGYHKEARIDRSIDHIPGIGKDFKIIRYSIRQNDYMAISAKDGK
jgi:hypothetical protein